MNTTERTIFEQFSYWKQAALPQPVDHSNKTYALIGCGTSYYLAMSVAARFNESGLSAFAVPGGEWLYRRDAYAANLSDLHVIAFSRSGESTETVRAAKASTESGLPVTAIVCDADSSLAKCADETLSAETHPEEGIVMTTSASLMLLMGYSLAGAIDTKCADHANGLLDKVAAMDLSALMRRSYFVFLGGGASYGIACEGALKMQEMSLTQAQAFHPLEFRHGPISLVDSHAAIISLYESDRPSSENALAGEVRSKGGFVLGLGGEGDLSLDVSGPDYSMPIVCLPVLQLLGERVARHRGIDTQSPRHLTKVVTIG